MKCNLIYSKCSNWLEKNISFFDPRINRTKVDSNLQFKAFIELVFMDNMFNPERVYVNSFNDKLNNLINCVATDIDFNTYFLFNHFLISGSEVLLEYYNERSIVPKVDVDKLREMVKCKLDVLPRRSPYRQLDVSYSLSKVGIKSNYPDADSLLWTTVISKKFNPLYLSDDLAYSITHTIFYITDMGRRDKEFILKYRVSKLLKTLIYFFELKNNVDLLSECLICLYFITKDKKKLLLENKELLNNAFNFIYSRQLDSGAEIAPGENAQLLSKKPIEAIFFGNYHTTLVTMGASYVYKKAVAKLDHK